MGLLNFADRYFPDEQLGSLLGGARRGLTGLLAGPDAQGPTGPAGGDYLAPAMRASAGLPADVAPFGGPAGAPMKADKATDGKPGFWATVDQVLGGKTITDARETLRRREVARRAEPAQAELEARIMDYIASLDPREQAIYFTKPETWATNAGEALKPRSVTAGNTEVRGDGSTFTAPVLGVNGDQGYTQTPDRFQVTGQRDPTHEETSLDDNRRATIAQLLASLRETTRHNQATEGLGWAQHSARERGGGYGTPGVGGVGDLSGISDDELLGAISQLGRGQ